MRRKIITGAACILLLALLFTSLGSCTQRPEHTLTVIRGGEVRCGCSVCAEE